MSSTALTSLLHLSQSHPPISLLLKPPLMFQISTSTHTSTYNKNKSILISSEKLTLNAAPNFNFPLSPTLLPRKMAPANNRLGSDETEPELSNNEKEYKKVEEEEPISGHAMKDVPVETERKTGVTFPVMLEDGKKQLNAIGLRKKSMLNIYAFGIYADNEKLKLLLSTKAPSKVTKEIYQMVIDSDVAMVIRLVIVFSGLTMSMVRKNFDQGLGASIKKLKGGKNGEEELTNKIMGETSDDIKLTPGSVIEISRLPGYTLQTKVKSEVVSRVESELLCRAYIDMYLGDDPLDKEARENFGASLLSLF